VMAWARCRVDDASGIGEKPLRLFVLDQGVRTWGNVRLALAAAAMVAIGKDTTKAGMLHLTATSNTTIIDVAGAKLNDLARLLEASDLTPNPADALRTAISETATGPRDIVLLTHRRSMHESDVLTEIAMRSPTDRVFALGVDDAGRAELVEFRGASIVRLRSFRVQFSARTEKQTAPKITPVSHGDWTGDIEPVTFPFRPGLIAKPEMFAFDAEGKWLACVNRNGIVHLSALDGSAPEVLPRVFRYDDGTIDLARRLMTIDRILGGPGGFVVCGHTGLPDATLLMASYDIVRHTVQLHSLPNLTGGNILWHTFPDLNSVAVSSPYFVAGLDLATGDVHVITLGVDSIDSKTPHAVISPASSSKTPQTQRAEQAAQRASRQQADSQHIDVWQTVGKGDYSRWLRLDKGCIMVGGEMPAWPPFTPKRNGRAFFDDAHIHEARYARDTLALSVQLLGRPERRLYLFHGPSGRLLSEFRHEQPHSFTLSPAGDWLAYRTDKQSLQLVSTENLSDPRTFKTEWMPSCPAVHCGTNEVCISAGQLAHAFTFGGGKFTHTVLPRIQAQLPASSELPAGVQIGIGGQVILLDRHQRPAIQILVRGDQAAIALPDGTRWGSVALLGCPPTPRAVELIDRALVSLPGGD